MQELLKSREGLLVVAGLGAPAWDATASGDHPLTFPLWGGMGGAVSIGLGLALAQPDQRVLIITGDGDCLLYTSPSPRDRQKSRMPSSA